MGRGAADQSLTIYRSYFGAPGNITNFDREIALERRSAFQRRSAMVVEYGITFDGLSRQSIRIKAGADFRVGVKAFEAILAGFC